MRARVRRLRPLVFAAALSWSAPAGAYTIESVATEGCHERITAEALRRVRSELAVAPPIESTEDEQAMLDDLQFSVDDDMGDLGAVALLFGVRDNDLKGQGSDDLTSLAFVHGDPDRQREHCLRSEDDDEPDGTTHPSRRAGRSSKRRWSSPSGPSPRRACPTPTTGHRSPFTSPFGETSSSNCPRSMSTWARPSTRWRIRSPTPTGPKTPSASRRA